METIKGDLIRMASAGKFDVVVHGCNCHCTMGSGIAKQIKKEFPDAFRADLTTTAGDYNKLGNYTKAIVEFPTFKLTVINAYTQYNYNSYGQRYDLFEYDAFKLILQKLLHEFGTQYIGFPLIGCGYAHGDKDKILSMLEDFSKKVEQKGGHVVLVEMPT